MTPSYRNGFYAPSRGGKAKYPELWDGCLGAWAPCLGPNGLSLRDNSGFGNHGVLTNMDPTTDWVVNDGQYALDFDGSNDYLSTAVNLNGLYKITLSCWFYWFTYGTNDDLLFEYSPNINTVGNHAFIIDPNSGAGRFDIMLSSGGSPYNGGHIPRPSTQIWHHLSVKLDRTLGTANNVSVSVDGMPEVVTQVFSSAITTPFTSSSLFFASRNGSNLFGNCRIDDVFIHNRILKDSEIHTLASRRGIAYETLRRKSYFLPTSPTTSRRYSLFDSRIIQVN